LGGGAGKTAWGGAGMGETVRPIGGVVKKFGRQHWRTKFKTGYFFAPGGPPGRGAEN